MALERREIVGGAPAAALAADFASGTDATFTIDDGTGYPDGSVGPFAICIDRGGQTEEKILCSGRSGNTLTVLTSGYDGTAEQPHTAGMLVEHVLTAVDIDEANQAVSQTIGKVSQVGDLLVGTAAGALDALHTGSDGALLMSRAGSPLGLTWSNLIPQSFDPNSIPASVIQDVSVTSAKLADGAVTTAKIADDAVTTAKIADDAVTTAQIANGAIDTQAYFGGSLWPVYVNAASPGGPSNDSFWWDSTTGQWYQRQSGQWVRANLGFQSPHVILDTSTALALNDGAWHAIAWLDTDVQKETDASMFVQATSVRNVEAPVSGTYQLSGQVSFTASATGSREIGYHKGAWTQGVSVPDTVMVAVPAVASGRQTRCSFTTDIQLAAGDVVQLNARTDGGGGGMNALSARFSVRLVSR